MPDLQILIVDDNPIWIEIVREQLDALDSRVPPDAAPSYGAALPLIRETRYDLAILDMSLLGPEAGGNAAPPDSNTTDPNTTDQLGMRVLRDLRESRRNRACAVLVLSGYPATAQMRNLLDDYQVYDFISKNQFNGEDFLAIARAAIAETQRRTIRQLETEVTWLVGVLFAAVHELGRPLPAIYAILQDLAAGTHGRITAKQETYLSQALEALQQELRLSERLLDWSGREANQLDVQQASCDIGECIRAAQEQLRLPAARKGLRLELDLPAAAIQVAGNQTLLTLAIRNVLDNAVKFTERGTIQVRCWHEEANVYIEVCDPGLGIPPDKVASLLDQFTPAASSPPGRAPLNAPIASIYDRFYQVTTPEQRPNGPGLGLFLAKKWLEMHNGVLEIESKEGQGSTFRLRLPALAG